MLLLGVVAHGAQPLRRTLLPEHLLVEEYVAVAEPAAWIDVGLQGQRRSVPAGRTQGMFEMIHPERLEAGLGEELAAPARPDAELVERICYPQVRAFIHES